METENPKKAAKLRERAMKDVEKLKKNFQKIQQKADELILKQEKALEENIKRMEINGKLPNYAYMHDIYRHYHPFCTKFRLLVLCCLEKFTSKI